MDKAVLIIEAPELSDEGVESVKNFLHDLILTFEAHYFHRLQRYSQQLSKQDREGSTKE